MDFLAEINNNAYAKNHFDLACWWNEKKNDPTIDGNTYQTAVNMINIHIKNIYINFVPITFEQFKVLAEVYCGK